MNVAVLQIRAGRYKNENVWHAQEAVERAAQRKAEFVLLPEIFVYRGKTKGKAFLNEIPETVPGPTTNHFKLLARKHRLYILLGSIYERVGKDNGKVYNTSVLLNPRGDIQAAYRKINLFDAVVGRRKIRESAVFLAGQKPVITNVHGFRIGLSICYDLRFPELYRYYGRRGVDLLCIPSCFTKTTGEAHWEILLRARAVENACYVLAPNQFGAHGSVVPAYGHSMIVDPWGKIVSRASGGSSQSNWEMVEACIDQRIIDVARRRLPGIHKNISLRNLRS